MGDHVKILIEVSFKGDACLPCRYLEEAVRQILERSPRG